MPIWAVIVIHTRRIGGSSDCTQGVDRANRRYRAPSCRYVLRVASGLGCASRWQQHGGKPASRSGATVGAQSETPHATYKARITVTVTPRPDDASSVSSSNATELEVADIKIEVKSGTFPHGDEDFKYLGADGTVYPPIASAGVGNALQSGDVTPGRPAEGDVIFRVPFGGGLVQLYGDTGAVVAWRSTS